MDTPTSQSVPSPNRAPGTEASRAAIASAWVTLVAKGQLQKTLGGGFEVTKEAMARALNRPAAS